jgi:hypothetical protein
VWRGFVGIVGRRTGVVAVIQGKDITFEWRKWDKTPGQQLAHPFAPDAANG